MMDTDAQVHQVQAVEAADENLCSIMQNLAIPDVEPVNSDMDTEWLYDGINVTIASTTSSQECKQYNFSPNNSQHDARTQDQAFEPFSPELAESARPMNIIQNLPNAKECEFDHQYITKHLEQLQIDPTLCSKCSPATKYFCSPEPVVQELYKKSCYWKQVPESTL